MSWFGFAIAATLFWGVAPLLARLGLSGAAGPDPLTALTVRSTGVAAAVLVAAALGGRLGLLKGVRPLSAVLILGEGLAGAFVGHLAYYYALKAGQASQVVPVTAAFPIVTSVLAVVLLGERLTVGRAVGSLLVVLGVWLIKVG